MLLSEESGSLAKLRDSKRFVIKGKLCKYFDLCLRGSLKAGIPIKLRYEKTLIPFQKQCFLYFLQYKKKQELRINEQTKGPKYFSGKRPQL